MELEQNGNYEKGYFNGISDILIVDDCPLSVSLLERLVHAVGGEAICFTDARKALDWALGNTADIILVFIFLQKQISISGRKVNAFCKKLNFIHQIRLYCIRISIILCIAHIWYWCNMLVSL